MPQVASARLVPLRRQGPSPGLELQRKSGHAEPMKRGFVYIMANRRNGVVYIGSTADLLKRLDERSGGDRS